MNSTVYLIGAGPGDPELLTLRGLRCLQAATCVVYDALVNSDLLQHAAPQTELICVGKRKGQQPYSQEAINQLLIQKAKEGKVVARLKGGDPFVFGRGGEEAEALSKAGIAFEIIPGVSSGIAVPAYAGIPVTHREYSSSVTFLTGHEDSDKEQTRIPWEQLGPAHGTLVFFMGAARLPEIVEQLTRSGRALNTPIAVIQWGTFSRQVVVSGTLDSILQQIQATPIESPAITIVGDVVRLREKLRWFESRPLFGKRIVVTRPRSQAEEIRVALAAYGAEVLPFPTLEIRPPDSWTSMDEAIARIASYDWLLFTSVNGVHHFFSRYRTLERDIRELKGVKLAAIGPATERALRDLNLKVEVLPDEYLAEGLVESLRGKVLKGSRILIARAKVARDVLPTELARQGMQVEVVEAYQSVLPVVSREELDLLFTERPVDMVVFTSSSTVSNLAELLKPKAIGDVLQSSTIAAIGPVTARTAEEHGLKVSVQPPQYKISSLVNAIVEYYAKAH
ncbi:MAG: uroporphyrinogen-III C-methyltransferase [Terriglobia bacterium]